MSKSYNHLQYIIRNQKKEEKIFQNSECSICIYDFVSELKWKDVNGKRMIICEKCYKKAVRLAMKQKKEENNKIYNKNT